MSVLSSVNISSVSTTSDRDDNLSSTSVPTASDEEPIVVAPVDHSYEFDTGYASEPMEMETPDVTSNVTSRSSRRRSKSKSPKQVEATSIAAFSPPKVSETATQIESNNEPHQDESFRDGFGDVQSPVGFDHALTPVSNGKKWALSRSSLGEVRANRSKYPFSERQAY